MKTCEQLIDNTLTATADTATSKIFLGGTCANSTWRDDLIPILDKLDMTYFNPVVEDWTEECIEIEEREKWVHCDIHLYMLTKEMKGVYSLIEFIDSIVTDDSNILSMLIVNTEGMDESTIKSLRASATKIKYWRDNDMIGNNVPFHMYFAKNQQEAFSYFITNTQTRF